MRVLITGGTGFLGRAVVRACAARGHDLVVFGRTAARSGLPGALVDGDIRDRNALERAAAGSDAICHMAALVNIWRPRARDFDEVNVGGLQNVLDAASTLGIGRILYTSSFLALPPAGAREPLEANDYQRTKVAADRLAEKSIAGGAPIVRVYPGVVYGPGPLSEGNLIGRLIADHLQGRLPGLIGPERSWSYAYAEDVATGVCAALERGEVGPRYILGGDNVPQSQVFRIVQQLTGRPVPRRMPFTIAYAIGAAEECRVRLFGGLPLVTRGTVDIFRYDWSLDSDLAIRRLGYAITPLDRGIRQTVASLTETARPGSGPAQR